MRGPGDILGTRQSGLLNFKIANLIKDQDILKKARNEARLLLLDDPDLSYYGNQKIKNFFSKYHQDFLKWGIVS